MNRITARLMVLALLAALACAGCKKTAEGETKKWTANKLALKKFSSKYDNLSEVIDEHLKNSQQKFDKAKKISDGEKKIKAMAAANEAARRVIRPFESYDLAIRETRRLIKHKKILKLPADRVKPAIKACKKAKKKAKKKLSEAVEDVDELVAKVESAASTVKLGMSRLKTLEREVDRAKKKKKKKKAKKGKSK